jgi:hypothetical protein
MALSIKEPKLSNENSKKNESRNIHMRTGFVKNYHEIIRNAKPSDYKRGN